MSEQAESDWDEGVVIYGPDYTRRLILAKAEKAGFSVGFKMRQWEEFLKLFEELDVFLCKVKDAELAEVLRERFAKGSATPEDGFRLRTKKREETTQA